MHIYLIILTLLLQLYLPYYTLFYINFIIATWLNYYKLILLLLFMIGLIDDWHILKDKNR